MDDWWDFDSGGSDGYGGDNYDYGGSEQAGWQGGADYAGGGDGSVAFDNGGYDYGGSADYDYSGDYGADYGGQMYGGSDYQFQPNAVYDAPSPSQWQDATNFVGPQQQMAGLNLPQYAAAEAPSTVSQAAVSGNFGGEMMDPNGANDQRHYGGAYQQSPTLADAASSAGGALKQGADSVQKWFKDNQGLVSTGIKALGALAGSNAQKAPEQMLARASANQEKNDAIAGKKESLADQAVADAKNIDPQQAGIDAMNKTQARTTNATNRSAAEMQKRGVNQATIDAEKRRASIGNTASGYQSYAQGYGQGQTQKQAGLRTAAGLYPTYSGFDSSAYNAGTQNANNNTAGIVGLLEDAAGNPTRKLREQEYLQ